MRRTLLAKVLWIVLLLWAVGIFYCSGIPANELSGSELLAWDKLNHFLAFAIGGWLAASAWRVGQPASRATKHLLAAILLVTIYGAFDELHQLYTPGRSGADVFDWIADFLGATAGAILAFFTHGHLERLVTRD